VDAIRTCPFWTGPEASSSGATRCDDGTQVRVVLDDIRPIPSEARPTVTPPSPDLSSLQLESTLPSLPAAALEVLRVCQDTDAKIDELAQALARDPMLAGRVLRVANSAFYHQRSAVTTLRGAAMVLGMRALKIVALGFTLANELPRRGLSAGLDLSIYWHRSLVNAVIARSLARSVNRNLVEEAFLCGLLSEIGKLALTHATPETYAPVVLEAGGWPSEELERARLGFSSSEAGEIILRGWQVPEVVVVGAAFADRQLELPGTAPVDGCRLAELVSLARIGTAALFAEDAHAGLVTFTEEAERRFGLATEEAAALVALLEAEVHEAAGMLSLDLPAGVSYQALLDQARLLMLSMSVDAAVKLEETSRTVEELSLENEHLEVRASTDELTGLPNRAALNAFLTQQVHLRLRDDLPAQLGVIMIDIDNFKSFNDRFGHQAGDEVLRSVGSALSQVVRRSDFMARYGGEEFCLVVPHATTETLAAAGERLRQTIEEHDVDLGPLGRQHVTASFGCALLAEVTAADDATKLVAAADVQLYVAKKSGRNRVAIAADPFVSA
jgi:diguanylate cyclase (GGDEF)-like protein